MRYEWYFGPAKVKNEDDLPDVVIEIAWQCTGFDTASDNVYKISGSIDTPPVDPEHFVPFDQISEQQVESWVFAQVNKSAVEAELLAQSQVSPDVKPFNF